MRMLKVLLGLAAVGAVALAFRDFERGQWLRPALPGGGRDRDWGGGGGADYGDDDEEPVLGYDGMDRDTLLDWLEDADLDEAALRRIERYERANLDRQPVLDAVANLLERSPLR